MEKKNYAARAAIYAMGLVILAAGITMNIKTGLGVSTIISVPFAISSIWDVNFSLVTFVLLATQNPKNAKMRNNSELA